MDYVKENQNTLDYNIWSGTEYKNNLEDIYYIPNTVKANPSTVWSSIGEQSLHLKSTTESYQLVLLKQIVLSSGTTVTAECDILHPKGGTIQLRIIQSNSSYNDVDIPVNNSPIHVSVSKLITESKTINIALILRDDDDEAYVDNVRLTTS